jgi:hypothetical protein
VNFIHESARGTPVAHECDVCIIVMVNCNQTGETAGTACVLALQAGLDVAAVDAGTLRETLAQGGSLIL